MPKVYLVGGPSDVRRQLEEKLAPHGIEIIGHWEYRKKQSGTVPSGADLVFVLTDMADHGMTGSAKAQAAEANVPVVPITRKWAITKQRLRDHLILRGDGTTPEVGEVAPSIEAGDIARVVRVTPQAIPCVRCSPAPCTCRVRELLTVSKRVAGAVANVEVQDEPCWGCGEMAGYEVPQWNQSSLICRRCGVSKDRPPPVEEEVEVEVEQVTQVEPPAEEPAQEEEVMPIAAVVENPPTAVVGRSVLTEEMRSAIKLVVEQVQPSRLRALVLTISVQDGKVVTHYTATPEPEPVTGVLED